MLWNVGRNFGTVYSEGGGEWQRDGIMDITPDKKRLLALVEQAAEGSIALPRFQRNFVWTREDITDLLASVLRNYYIRSFLLLEIDPDDSPFDYRPITGSPKSPEDIHPYRLLLDGQQRLTSLHYVFTARDIPLKSTKYPYRFFLRLDEILGGDLDRAIFSERADHCGPWLELERQFQQQVVPFTDIRRWDEWLNAFEHWLIQRDKDYYLGEYFFQFRPRWDSLIKVLEGFAVPTIELPKIPAHASDKVAEVCAIFEKINSTGVKLSVFDLLTARLYRHGIDLHQLWRKASDGYDLLAEFAGRDNDPDPYGLFLLRTVALSRGLEVKSRSLINLSPDNFEADWWKAAEYTEKAPQRITSTTEDGFGVFEPKWLPYSTMIPVTAALLRYIEEFKIGAPGFAGLKAWYWASVFLEHYAGAVESTSAADYRDLVAWFRDPSFRPGVFEEARRYIVENPTFSLRETARVNAVYRGIMNLIAIRGAKDFEVNDSIEFHVLDDHHIFPQAYLAKRSDRHGAPINTIVNKTLISAQTNRKISGHPPSRYLAGLIPQSKRAEILATHFIEGDVLAALEADDYPRFLDARERLLLAHIRKVVAPPQP